LCDLFEWILSDWNYSKLDSVGDLFFFSHLRTIILLILLLLLFIVIVIKLLGKATKKRKKKELKLSIARRE